MSRDVSDVCAVILHMHANRVGLAQSMEREALTLVLASDSFAGAGTLAHDERLAELWTRPYVGVGERTAEEQDLTAGDVVDVRSGERVVRDLPVRVVEGLPTGTATLLDGLPGAPAAGLRDGDAVVLGNKRAAREPVGANR